MFNGMCKVDYINDNISESFNSKINAYKELPIVELLDKIRQYVVAKMELRGRIAGKLEGKILPHIVKELNANSRDLKGYRITRYGPSGAEVSTLRSATNDTRYAVELDERMCSCNQWQISGKPCNHTVAFIFHTRGKLEDFVDDYFRVDKFKASYAGVFRPIPDRSQWESIDPGFKLYPPNLKRPTGRPKTQRYKDHLEQPFRTRQPCKWYGELGHHQKGCKNNVPTVGEEAPAQAPTNKRKRVCKKRTIQEGQVPLALPTTGTTAKMATKGKTIQEGQGALALPAAGTTRKRATKGK